MVTHFLLQFPTLKNQNAVPFSLIPLTKYPMNTKILDQKRVFSAFQETVWSHLKCNTPKS
jgi:hypothetical protein